MTYTTYKNLESGSHYSESDVEGMLNDSIDDSYGIIEICGLKFSPSRILRELDPIGYRGMFLDFTDGREWDEVSHDSFEAYWQAIDSTQGK
jgi:hypothetical protein